MNDIALSSFDIPHEWLGEGMEEKFKIYVHANSSAKSKVKLFLKRRVRVQSSGYRLPTEISSFVRGGTDVVLFLAKSKKPLEMHLANEYRRRNLTPAHPQVLLRFVRHYPLYFERRLRMYTFLDASCRQAFVVDKKLLGVEEGKKIYRMTASTMSFNRLPLKDVVFVGELL